jgi:cell division protein FtsI (penicillin-binding protein 3)
VSLCVFRAPLKQKLKEPGTGFCKLVDLMAILEDKVADTSTIYDTNGGEIRYSGKQ